MAWVHTDPELQAQAERGLRIAEGRQWASEPEPGRARAFRGLLARAALAMALCDRRHDIEGDGSDQITVDLQGLEGWNADYKRGAETISGIAGALAKLHGWDGSKFTADAFSTQGFATTSKPGGAGFPIVLGVVGIALAGAAICYLGAKALEIWDRSAERDAQSAKFAQALAGATSLVEKHVEADKQAGAKTPLSEAERAALDLYGKAAGVAAAPLPSMPSSNASFDLGSLFSSPIALAGAAWIAWEMFFKKG